MPIAESRPRLPNEPFLPLTSNSPPSKPSKKRDLAKRIRKLAITILRILKTLFTCPVKKLLSGVFSFRSKKNRPEQSRSHSPSDALLNRDPITTPKRPPSDLALVPMKEITQGISDAQLPQSRRQALPFCVDNDDHRDGNALQQQAHESTCSDIAVHDNDFVEILPTTQAGNAQKSSTNTLAGSISYALQNNSLSPHLKLLFGLPTEVQKGRANPQGCDRYRPLYFKREFPELHRLLKSENLDREDHSKIWELLLREIRKGLSNSKEMEISFLFAKINYFLLKSLNLDFFAQYFLESNFQIDNHATLDIQIDNLERQTANPSFFKNLQDPLSYAKTQGLNLVEHAIFRDLTAYNPIFLGPKMRFQLKKDLEICTCDQLCHLTPICETALSSMKIAPEYDRFVSEAGKKGQKILYSNFRYEGPDENKKISAFKDFEQKNSNFFFITFPLLNDISDLSITSKDSFCNYLVEVMTNQQMSSERGFYFSNKLIHVPDFKGDTEWLVDKIPHLFISERVQVWANFLKNNLIDDSDIMPSDSGKSNREKAEEEGRIKTNRIMFFTLLLSLLRRDIVHQHSINFCNNTCIDSAGKGAIHLFYDVFWSIFLNKEEKHNQAKNLLNLIFFPATFAGEQIQSDDLRVVRALLKKIGSLSEKDKDDLRKAWDQLSLVKFARFEFADSHPNLDSLITS